MDFLEEELEEILNIFQQEGSEILEAMDKNLLALEQKPANLDAALHLFRDAHSLKGSARMLGFNNIQNIAHKIEDVLGLIKEKKLVMNSKIAGVISKALECISEMIEKTTANKKEYTCPSIVQHILALENLVSDKEITPQKEPSPEADNKPMMQLVTKIEAYIIECIYMFSKFKTDGHFENFDEIKTRLNELEKIAKDIEEVNFESSVKEAIDIANKIQDPDDENIEENLINLNSSLEDIASKFAEIAEKNEIVPKNYYEIVSEKLGIIENTREVGEKEQSLAKADMENLLSDLAGKIRQVDTNIEFLPKIKKDINEIISKTKNSKIKTLYKTLLRIIGNQEASNTPFSKDALNAMSEIIGDTLGILQNNNVNSQLDAELLNQRALIIEQMGQMNVQETTERPRTAVAVPQEGFSAQDWLNSIDSSAIKTLRINSSKLDQLVNQVGDLIVTRIKTTEQLTLARNIQNDFTEWQKSWHKLGHYIKYFDRKYLNNPSSSREVQNTVAYNRQLMSLYNVHSEKMANLMDATQHLHKQLQENDAKLSIITTELEAMIKNMRVLPLATIFHLFPRMVHNIAQDKGKEMDFRVMGSDVSVDKKIIEDIKIPLMHIIRNSIDHGIETPEERRAAGKKETGLILIRARHQESKIIIDIEDDGRGINVDKIKKKALAKGLLTPEEAETLPEEQIVSLIFYPGFSTEEVVTELSGRGLGLDIVHTKISQLNGRIDIRSQLNKGTITTITLPASMATIKAFIVSEQNQSFAIPTAAIETVLRINPEEIFLKEGRNNYIYNKQLIPVFTLSQILQFDEMPREGEKYTLMILESENTKAGVIVDKLIGDQEILHKKLSLPLFKVRNISGIATLASGESCLILNVTDILNNAVPKKFLTTIVATNKQLSLEKNSNYQILVVDDSLTTRTLQKNILAGEGYQVCFATNAIDGLKMLETELPDLIVTDNEMPEMSGLEFVRHIREQANYSEIPIIVLTSLKREEWQEKFFDAGAQRYIQKGEFDQEFYLQCISDLLGKNRI